MTPVFFIHGNRDFLIGEAFARHTGIRLLPDAVIVDLYDRTALLLHGDVLCTDDINYQQLRAMLRDKQWQNGFLALPLPERIRQALALREKSAAETGAKDAAIMDVNQEAVAATLRQHHCNLMIHGHTHRPAIHDFELDGEAARRAVLGDWYQRGSVLIATPDSLELTSFG